MSAAGAVGEGPRDNQYRDRGEVHVERGHSARVPASVSEDQDRKSKVLDRATEMVEPPESKRGSSSSPRVTAEAGVSRAWLRQPRVERVTGDF